jgi:hypothetical protein
VDPSGSDRHAGSDEDVAEAAAPDVQPGVDAKAGEGFMTELFDSAVDPSWERRQDRRYECQLSLRYRSGQECNAGAGTAMDISRGGIAVNIPQTLAHGSPVELIVDWPCMSEQVGTIRLMIQGQVVRSDSRRTAIAIERHEFLRDRVEAATA